VALISNFIEGGTNVALALVAQNSLHPRICLPVDVFIVAIFELIKIV
jgi:hypothetical protein